MNARLKFRYVLMMVRMVGAAVLIVVEVILETG